MKRPSKKDIKASVEKLKEEKNSASLPDRPSAKLSPKQSSQRIRKKGI